MCVCVCIYIYTHTHTFILKMGRKTGFVLIIYFFNFVSGILEKLVLYCFSYLIIFFIYFLFRWNPRKTGIVLFLSGGVLFPWVWSCDASHLLPGFLCHVLWNTRGEGLPGGTVTDAGKLGLGEGTSHPHVRTLRGRILISFSLPSYSWVVQWLARLTLNPLAWVQSWMRTVGTQLTQLFILTNGLVDKWVPEETWGRWTVETQMSQWPCILG